ncbi:hypothetical protein B0H11DRAFT_2247856 [Mycena galericulata]|nr:hypothetical protein B0H11DRAFT_2247856 [Mycena galericulata]
MIMARFPPKELEEKIVVRLMKPALSDVLIAGRSIAEVSGSATDCPEYGADSNIVDSDTSFDLNPLEYILLGTTIVKCIIRYASRTKHSPYWDFRVFRLSTGNVLV